MLLWLLMRRGESLRVRVLHRNCATISPSAYLRLRRKPQQVFKTQPGDHTSKLAMLNRTDSSLASQTFEATEKEPPGLAKPESGQRPLDLGLVVALAPWSRPRSTTNPCGHRVWGITKLGFQTFGFSKRRLIWSDTCLSRHGDGGKIFPNQGKIYSAKNGFMVQATWPHSSGV